MKKILYLGENNALGNHFFGTTVFVSKRKLDANFNTDTVVTDDGIAVSSILLGGLHRTESEIAKKNVLTEIVSGADVHVQKGIWKFGAVGIGHACDVACIFDGGHLHA